MPARGEQIICRPLTPERWDDLCAVFGSSGACYGCWCMYWRAPRKDFIGPARKHMKRRFRARVMAGPPPGLIAYRGEAPIGWVQVSPRADTPNWNGVRRLSAPIDAADAVDPKVWGISCFVVPRAHRGQGVARTLLDGAVRWARKNGARVLDACPVEPKDGRANPVSIYHGVASMFEATGFKEVARRRADRPLMRLDLRA